MRVCVLFGQFGQFGQSLIYQGIDARPNKSFIWAIRAECKNTKKRYENEPIKAGQWWVSR